MTRRFLLIVLATLLLATVLPVTAPTAVQSVQPAPSGPLCDHSWAGLDRYNEVADLRQGVFGAPWHPDHKVAVGSNVNWRLDPFEDLSWRMWLDTVAWVGPLIESYDDNGVQSDLNLALAYMQDYVTDQPMNASTDDDPVLQQTSYRLQTMVCLRERVSSAPWLDEAIAGTVAFLKVHWAGLYNHGLDQDLAILAAGCQARNGQWTDAATARLVRILKVSIDDQGATNEQASNYAKYPYERWLHVQDTIETCGLPPMPTLATKLQLAREHVVHITQPDGKLVPVGDTAPGTVGVIDPAPRALSRVWSKAGWALGRSSWTPQASFYSLRFGPGRTIHGTPDHGSVSYYAHGSPVIVEPGSIGYTHRDVPWFRRAPEAHSSLLVGGGRCHIDKTAVPSIWRPRVVKDRYVVRWPTCSSATVTRDLTYTRASGVLTVSDTTNRLSKATQFRQLWHLVPGVGMTAKRTSKYVVVVKLTMPNRSKATLTIRSAKSVPFTFKVIKGQRNPYQGWVSGGFGKPVPARVIVLEQKARQADLQFTLTPR